MNLLSLLPRHPRAGRWGVLLLAGALAGCGGNGPESYKVAKEQAPAAAAQSAALPAGHPDLSSAGPALQWNLPGGWKEVAPGQMRVASFQVAGGGGQQADVSVVPLPGEAGSDLANVNRWRGQVGQSPVTEAELANLAQPVEVAGQKALLFEQNGSVPGSGGQSRILAAVLRREGVAWFFKMTGDDALVAQQKPAFVGFLKSLKFGAAAAAPGQLPPFHPPIGAAGAGPMAAASVIPTGPAGPGPDKPVLQVPKGWEEVPAGAFLVAKFSIHGSSGEQAAVNVSTAPGEGGGLVGNVNRWRQQLGLAQAPPTEVEKLVTSLEAQAGKAMVVDMTGADPRTGQKTRLVAAVVPQGNQTWFYKLMGSEPIVEREKDAFTQLVKGAKYPDAK